MDDIEDNEMLLLNPDDLLSDHSMSPKGPPKTTRFDDNSFTSQNHKRDHSSVHQYKNQETSITNP
jgi:hypothetical protein